MLKPSAALLWRALMFAAGMFAAGYLWNVASFSIWWLEGNAPVLFPLLALFWGMFGVAIFIQTCSAAGEERRRFGLYGVIAAIVMSPIAWFSLVNWERPIMISQVLVAQFLRDTFR